MRRELRTVEGDRAVGALVIDDGTGAIEFERYASDALARLRRTLGDEKAARAVMADGWSNGYLYFSDPV
jgi:hypothetical protein